MKIDDFSVGTANDAAGAEFIAGLAQIVADGEKKEAEWIEHLRQQGIKAAHPNDGWMQLEHPSLGWMNRGEWDSLMVQYQDGREDADKRITLQYPQFNDGVDVGDNMVLGNYRRPEEAKVIQLTEAMPHTHIGLVADQTTPRFKFEYVGDHSIQLAQ